MPTQKQSNTAIFVCQLLSNLYQPIQIFRYDHSLRTLYIQAGSTDGIALIIDSEGIQRFASAPGTSFLLGAALRAVPNKKLGFISAQSAV